MKEFLKEKITTVIDHLTKLDDGFYSKKMTKEIVDFLFTVIEKIDTEAGKHLYSNDELYQTKFQGLFKVSHYTTYFNFEFFDSDAPVKELYFWIYNPKKFKISLSHNFTDYLYTGEDTEEEEK
jgi:hypothetical protein